MIAHCMHRVQRRERVLKDHLYMATVRPQGSLPPGFDHLFPKADGTCRRRVEACQQARHRCLATSAFPY